jgi:protein SCO1/2
VRWLLVVGLAGLVLGCQPQPALDVFGRLPSFTLRDQTDAAFSSEQLIGRVAAIDFIYTHCTDACPVLSANFAQAQRKLADEKLLGTKVMLVSLSVDPVHDTPSVLAEYGQRFKADPQGWKFLTGDWEDVYDVVSGLKVAVKPPRPALDAPAPGGTELTHSTRVVLVDGQGQVRAYLDGQDEDLVAAIRRVF